MKKDKLTILSIETSCDETAISILKAKGNISNLRHGVDVYSGVSFEVLANSLSSQVKIHAKYGGVYPMMAKREHIKNLPILFKRVLKKAKLENRIASSVIRRGDGSPFDIIAVTSGPGLEPALWTGITFARELAEKYNIPIIPVNHMEGHVFSVFAKDKGKFDIPLSTEDFPILSLLVSGGHTEFVLMENWLKYKIIGQTLDDAVGEAFDKVARMLALPYPGGPEISKLAEMQRNIVLKRLGSSTERARGIFQQKNIRAFRESISFIKLPRPMMYSKNFDFSFSGIKTAVLYLIRDLKKEKPDVLEDDKIKMEIALEFENAVVETLVYKTKKAIEKYGAKTLIVAGGVSANKHLKKEIQKLSKQDLGNVKVLFPDKDLTGDNSIMIGVAGYLEYIQNPKKFSKKINLKAEGGLRFK